MHVRRFTVLHLVGLGGASRTVTVAAPTGCVNTIPSYESWTGLSSTQGSGTWTTTVTVGPNMSAEPRVASLRLAGTILVIEQNGADQDSVFMGEGAPSNDYAHSTFAWLITASGQIQGTYGFPHHDRLPS